MLGSEVRAVHPQRRLRWPGRLRVAVPRSLEHWSPRTGHGRVWHSVLRELAPRVRLHQVDLDGAAGRGPLRPADVWLADGHAAPPAVDAPVVVLIHEASWLDPEVRAHLPDALVDSLAGPTARAACAAAAVLTDSEWSRATIVDGGLAPAGRVHAVHLGVDAGRFAPERADAARVAARVPRLDGRPYVLFVGHVGPRKNLPALRSAMAGLARRGLPHALVVAAGVPPGHPDAAELRAAALAELPGAPGRVLALEGADDDDLAAVLAGAAALCLPSHAEGFGLPALEAMASGTPVVVSDRGALPEVVGDAGLVVEPAAEALEDALARVLEDAALAARLSAAGRERALGMSWARTAEGWLDVLAGAAGRRR
jgi:alpha-1,3-rhamnosyl/mannosyltransferase